METIEEKFGSFENAIKIVENFHGKENVPGITFGVYMLDLGLKKFYEKFKEKNVKFNAVCETNFCLPDVLQSLMHITIGVRYLKIINVGKFAYTIYNRDNGYGVRVWVDIKKIEKENLPNIYSFFTRTRKFNTVEERKKSDKEVIKEFLSLKNKYAIFSYGYVKVKFAGKEEILPVKICEICGEGFTTKDNKNICEICSGKELYFLYL